MKEVSNTNGEAKPTVLPVEVIGFILTKLEKADLLNSRLVCKSWNVECLRVLNNSKWTLPLDQHNIKKYVRFLKSVQTPQLVLPLRLSTEFGYDFVRDLEFLFRVFGKPSVQALYLSIRERCHFLGNMALLEKVCKRLEKLEIYEDETEITPERVKYLFSRNPVAFPNLKTFNGITIENIPNFFRTLMTTMSNLKAVDLFDLDMDVVVDSLSNMESLETLKVYNFKPTLRFLQKIREVKPRLREFNFYCLKVENDEDSTLFVKILNCLSLLPTLEKLIVGLSSNLKPHFQFPGFPNLKHLKFRDEVPDHIQRINVNAHTFPVLESWEISIYTLQPEEADDDDEYETEDEDETEDDDDDKTEDGEIKGDDDDKTEDGEIKDDDEDDKGDEEADPPAQTSRFSPILRSIISAVRFVARALKPTCIGQPTKLTSPDQDRSVSVERSEGLDRSDSLDRSQGLDRSVEGLVRSDSVDRSEGLDRSDSLDAIPLSAPAQNPDYSGLKHLSVRSEAVVWTWNPNIFPAMKSLALHFQFFYAKQTIQFPTVQVVRVIFDGISLDELPEIRLSDQCLRGNLERFHTMFPTLSKIVLENVSNFEPCCRHIEKAAPYFCTRFLKEFLLTVSGKNLKEIQVLNDVDRDRNYLGDVLRQLQNPPRLLLQNFEGTLQKPLKEIISAAWDEYIGKLIESGVDAKSKITPQPENDSILFERNNGKNRVIHVFKDTERIRMSLRSFTIENPGFPSYDKHKTDFKLIAKYFPNLRELDIPAYWFENLEEGVRWEQIQNIRALFPGIVLNRVEPLTRNIVTV